MEERALSVPATNQAASRRPQQCVLCGGSPVDSALEHDYFTRVFRRLRAMHVTCMLWFESCLPSHAPPRHSRAFSVFVLAEIVPIIPCLSAPVSASIPARDAKGEAVGREGPPGLSRPFSSCRMSNVWRDIEEGLGGETEELALFLPVMTGKWWRSWLWSFSTTNKPCCAPSSWL